MSVVVDILHWVVSLIIIAVVVVASFWNSLDNAFAFDDHLAITNNHDVKDPDAHRIWTDDIWGKELSAHDSHKSFRPLLILLFRTLWSISSEARWFREVSLAAHIVSTYLFYCVSLIIWNDASISMAAAVLFAAHPIHVESVAAVVNMAEAFSASFILLSYILFLRHTSTTSPPKFSLAYWAGVFVSIAVWVVLVVLASLFKETGISCCLLVVCKTTMDVVLWCLRALSTRKSTARACVDYSRCVVYALFTGTAFATVYVYLAFRSMMTSVHRTEMLSDANKTFYALILKPILETETESYLGSSQLLRKAENPFSLLQDWEKIYSTMYLHYLYMVKLIYPAEQSPEYAFNCIPKVSSMQDFRAQLSLCMYATILLIGVYGLYQALCSRAVQCSAKQHSADVSSVDCKEKCVEPVMDASDNSDSSTAPAEATTTNVPKHKATASNQHEASNVDDDASAGSSCAPKPTEETTTSDVPISSTITTVTIGTIGDIPADTVLHTLMLLVVFFLPASGIVFRLGTLLAERLMYTPSIASCMFLAAAWYAISWGAAKTLFCCAGPVKSTTVPSPSKQEPSRTTEGDGSGATKKTSLCGWATVFAQTLFWCGIIALTVAYAQRTLTYSKVWHDDNTLFVESLAVCPQSAKMNLQVSKVWSQRGNFKKARKHLEIAQKIDPDFCDTGYQDVVITMSVAATEGGRNYLDIAAEKAVKNLHCIYTNSATITLLSHIWSSQLQAAQATSNKHTIYRELQKQGDIASRGDVKFLAAQKYIEASSIAFDAQEVDDAVELGTKAEKIITKLESIANNATALNSAQASDQETELAADIRCRIFTLNGCFRASQMQAPKKPQGSGKKSKSNAAEKAQKRVEALLNRAVFRDCTEATLLLPESGSSVGTNRNLVVVEHLPLAVNHLISMWTAKMSGANQADSTAIALDATTTRPQQLSAYAQDLTAVYHVVQLLHQRTWFLRPVDAISSVGTISNSAVAVAGTPASSAQPSDKITELRDVVAKLAANAHQMSGAQYLHAQNVSAAVNSFRQSLLIHSPVYVKRVVGEKFHGGVHRKDVVLQAPVIEDFVSMALTPETCMSLHWLSETLASSVDFRSNDGLSQELSLCLKQLIKCLKSKLYASPKLNLDNLRAILKSLPKAVQATESNEIEVA